MESNEPKTFNCSLFPNWHLGWLQVDTNDKSGWKCFVYLGKETTKNFFFYYLPNIWGHYEWKPTIKGRRKESKNEETIIVWHLPDIWVHCTLRRTVTPSSSVASVRQTIGMRSRLDQYWKTKTKTKVLTSLSHTFCVGKTKTKVF